ncbi:endonuclease/exonuclease/phosphatase family protein [Photobacterium sp. BZF1]|uniref:endonuclease/exonuclease/phosphatase family protein n=1 Tax=Photobacterium sp. BZF1 TaxID=1904457 RepID=UPI00165378F9|nr:endonuclease/exonuclease/phosphatase family protein [Photobacterium sp. BZF1]MBC7002753.1 endonuclease/exonuclease/phosphatase family protein [Photobacterium sp. BZF1]
MQVVSWNIQNGIDAFGNNKKTAQIQYLNDLDVDVIALQEVDQHYFVQLQNELKDYTWHLLPAISYYQGSQPKAFGNVLATRLPVIQWRNHSLLPASSDAFQHMPRCVGEIVVQTAKGPLRVLTTHLEFHCAEQRHSQLEQIENIILSAKVLNQSPSQATDGLYRPLALPEDCLLCGDFNIVDTSGEYLQQFRQRSHWHDLAKCNPQPTCGVYDLEQWPNGADRRDYFFALGDDLKGQVWVDTDCSLSDHQPIILTSI